MRRILATAAVVTFTLGGVTACGNDDDGDSGEPGRNGAVVMEAGAVGMDDVGAAVTEVGGDGKE